jgi:hypothetical protein
VRSPSSFFEEITSQFYMYTPFQPAQSVALGSTNNERFRWIQRIYLLETSLATSRNSSLLVDSPNYRVNFSSAANLPADWNRIGTPDRSATLESSPSMPSDGV